MLRLCLVILFAGNVELAMVAEPPADRKNPMIEPLQIEACVEDVEDLLSLDYWTFDQDPERGIRTIWTKPGCELAAADLYRIYHQRLRDKGEPVIVDIEQGTYTISQTGELTILYWHEGQIRAGVGQTDQAIDLFEKSLKPEDKNRHAWNEYARASIAFLEGDRDELLRQRAAMAERVEPDDINLGAVDSLIACFGKSYKEAYGSKSCNRRPGFED